MWLRLLPGCGAVVAGRAVPRAPREVGRPLAYKIKEFQLVNEPVDWSEPEAVAVPPAAAAVTPADAADAARLVAFGLAAQACRLLGIRSTPSCCGGIGRTRPSPGSPTLLPPGSGWSCWRCPRARGWPSPLPRTPFSPCGWATTRVVRPPTGRTGFCTGSPISPSPPWRFRGPRISPTTGTSGASPSTGSRPSYGRPAGGWRSGPRRRGRTPTRPVTPPGLRPLGGSG
jgi:hypothetical protein